MEWTKSSEKGRVISEATIRKYVKKLKSGLAAGIDGITGKHLKNARHTRPSLLLSQLLTICVQYGVLPDKFCEGILVPIMKKMTLDPAWQRVIAQLLCQWSFLRYWSNIY